MKYLVTGGCGFIGNHLVKHLKEGGATVHVLDNLFSAKRLFRSPSDRLIVANVASYSLDTEYDVIYHLAAITDPRSESKYQIVWNCGGFDNMLSEAKKMGAKFVFASSGSVYGISTSTPFKEEDGSLPFSNVYAMTKLVCDEKASHYFDRMNIVGLRFFNVYGPGEAHKGQAASMIHHIAAAIKKNLRPRLFKYGEHRRDFVHVHDCIQALDLAAGADVPSGIYNIGSGNCTSFNEVVECVNYVLKSSHQPVYIDNPYESTYQSFTLADITKAQNSLGYQPKYLQLDEGIESYASLL